MLISIDDLISQGLLDASDAPPRVPVRDIDFVAVSFKPRVDVVIRACMASTGLVWG